ncbi:Vacuolar protein sorting-associated protein 35, partial [Cladochytrium tenue]
IPGDVELFEVFWGQITTLVNARPEFSVQDVVALVVSLMNLSLNCYPDRLDHIDVVLGFAKERVLEAIAQKAPELFTPQTRSSLLQLLLGPIQAYRYNPLTLLSFPSCRGNHAEAAALGIPPSPSIAGNYADLLALQPFSTRRQVAHTLALAALRASALLPPAPAPPTPQQQQAPAATSGPLPVPVGGGRPFRLDSPDAVNAVFGELCSVMVRDQEDGGLFGPRRVRGQQQQQRSDPDDLPLDWDDVVEEQNLVAKLVHLISSESEDPDDDLMLLDAARRHFGQGGDLRIRFTLPPLVIDSIQLSRRFAALEEPTRSQRLSALFGFIYETVVTLSRAQEYSPDDDDDYGRPLFRDSTTGSPSSSGPKVGRGLLSPPDMSLRLSLLAAKAADEARVEESAYEFFVQALTTYEESVSESRAQAVAMSLVIGALHSASAFGFENYETLATKCAVHCARLLRRVDQCRGVALVSHLFWGSAGDAAMAPRDPVVAASAAEERAAAAREEAALRALRDAGRPAYRDGKRVLECLQRALRAADSVMDRAVSVELFVEILERYLWHYAARNDAVAPKAVN